MKLTLSILLLCMAFTASAQQISGTNSLSLQAVNNTTANGTGFSLGTITLPARTHIIQHNGIAGQTAATNGLNSLTVNVQLSFDGSNWTTVKTYNPASTNAAVDSISISPNSVTCYMRVQAVTTNNVTVGVTTVRQR